MDDTLARVRARVAERFPADLERIRDYLRLPWVSATGEGIGAVAEATGAWIEGAGGSFELQATPGHPLVVGELPGPPGAPRLLRYGMYDVQPAQEPDWTSPPFAAEVRDLPGVGPAVVARAGDLTAEGAFDLDLTAGLDGRPGLILGCKGLCDLELSCAAGDWGGPGPGEDDRRLLAELAAGFDPAERLREAEAARYRLEGGPAALLFRPILNISGIAAGYVGPGGKTIVPSRAVARVDIRLVGGDPEAAAAAVRRHLDGHGFGHVQVRLLDAYPWAKAAPGNRSEAALRASYQAFPLAYADLGR